VENYNSSKKSFKGKEDKAAALMKQANLAFNEMERKNVETLWAELAEFILPSQNGKFNGDMSKGDKKDRRRYDDTATMACRDLSASLHSTITNPSTKWSKFRFRETHLNDIPEGNYWTATATNEVHNYLNDSNFDNQIGRSYQSYTGLGTMAILHDELNDNGMFKGMNFSAWHLSEIAYAENYLGVVDCIYRKFKLTLKQCYEQFGEAIGEDLLNQLEAKPLSEQELYLCIYPRDKDEVKLNQFGEAAPEHRPYAACYILCKGKKIVKEDGYYEFPVYVSRWLTLPGEIYGFGPGHIARGATLTLNAIARQMLKGLAKAIDPVIFQEQGNILSGDMRPGKLVSVRNIAGLKEGVTQSRFDIGFLESKDLRDAIKSAFYIDKLILPPRTETGEMTAYEIQQRLEQMQVILGPPLSRLNVELLQPLIMRTLKILLRAGKIPPVPQKVLNASQAPRVGGNKEINIDIAFVNSLARSQQMAEIRNISSWIQETAGIAQLTGKPDSIDIINIDEAVEKMARIRDIPEELVNTDEEIKAARDQRAQAVQAQSALQAGESMGKMSKDMAASKGGGIQ